MRTWTVSATLVGLLAGGCAGSDAGTRPTAADEVTASVEPEPAGAGCATESDLGIDSGGGYPFFASVEGLPQHDPHRLRTYVANPTSAFRVDGWDPDTDLPDRAIDTGWRRGTTELWLAGVDGRDVAYLVDGPTVERLPLDDSGQGCE